MVTTNIQTSLIPEIGSLRIVFRAELALTMLGYIMIKYINFLAFLLATQAVASVPKMTTCRLAAMEKISKTEVLCFYIGAQNTQESHTSELYLGCMRQYACEYNPLPPGTSLRDTLDSIKDALK